MKRSKPAYLQIYEKIRFLIRDQTYKPGDLLPTEHELVEQFGVSRPTISKALKMLGDEKLVRRRAGFGTQVLAPDKSMLTAGFLVPQIRETEIFGPICAGIAEAARDSGMRIVQPTEPNLDQAPQMLAESLATQLIDAKVLGVFFAPVEHIEGQQEFNLGIIERLKRNGIQVVLLDRDVYAWPRQTPYDLIGIDNIEAGFVMANHLLENGCERLAFTAAENPAMTVQLRRIGIIEALRQSGRRSNTLRDVAFDPQHPERAARELKDKKVDGVVCANDATAAPLLRELIDLGVEIPDSMQVCGFDDVKYASLLSVPLSSYRQPCRDIGKAATQIMISRIRFPDSPTLHVTLKGELVVRNSSRDRLGALSSV